MTLPESIRGGVDPWRFWTLMSVIYTGDARPRGLELLSITPLSKRYAAFLNVTFDIPKRDIRHSQM